MDDADTDAVMSGLINRCFRIDGVDTSIPCKGLVCKLKAFRDVPLANQVRSLS